MTLNQENMRKNNLTNNLHHNLYDFESNEYFGIVTIGLFENNLLIFFKWIWIEYFKQFLAQCLFHFQLQLLALQVLKLLLLATFYLLQGQLVIPFFKVSLSLFRILLKCSLLILSEPAIYHFCWKLECYFHVLSPNLSNLFCLIQFLNL